MKNFIKKFINFDSDDQNVIKRSKNIVSIASIIFTITILTFVVANSVDDKNIKINNTKQNLKNKIDIASSIGINPEDEWLSKSENDLKSMQFQIKELTEQLKSQQQKQQEDKETYNRMVDSLVAEVSKVRDIQQEQNTAPKNNRFNEYGELLPTEDEEINTEIQTISIDLEEEQTDFEDENFKDLENYIPAGSYATAKMLSGADVSTGVNSQSDPNNMMFEIISPAFAPKFKGKTQKIKKIEGCRIMGAAIGQLWTEKAYIRLLKMSCSFEEGRVAEFNVRGYVTSFAKEGVRGKVVSREGYFTSMAFLAGAVEGLADVTEAAYSPTMEVASGIATESVSSGDVARQAGASGFGKAAEMLSDYYIDRAEQYQSVIDVPTGVEVEIVFQEGVDLSGNPSFKTPPNEMQAITGNNGPNNLNQRIQEVGKKVQEIKNLQSNNGRNTYNNNGVF